MTRKEFEATIPDHAIFVDAHYLWLYHYIAPDHKSKWMVDSKSAMKVVPLHPNGNVTDPYLCKPCPDTDLIVFDKAESAQ